MSFFYITGVSNLVGVLLLIFGLLSSYALFSSVFFWGKNFTERMTNW